MRIFKRKTPAVPMYVEPTVEGAMELLRQDAARFIPNSAAARRDSRRDEVSPSWTQYDPRLDAELDAFAAEIGFGR